MKEVGICILGLGAYLPDHVMSNEDWAQYVDTSDEWIRTRTGIKERRIAATDESTADLAVAAAQLALDDAELSAEQIDEIIVATDTPEVFIPDTACFIQHRLRAREIPAYELGASGCAGFLQALDIARARVNLNGGRILVIGVDMLTRMISWQQRETSVLFGDAAGAAIVGHSARGAKILCAVAGTDGSQSNILGMAVGGTREPFTLESAQQDRHRHVVMNGREVFKAAVRRMCEATSEILEKANFTLQEIALVIPHQANVRIIQAVAKTLGLPLDKFYINLHKYGNTGAASIPVALWEARKDGRIVSGDIVLLTGFGAGFHWGAVLLQF